MRVRAVLFRVPCALAGCIAVASLSACLGPQPNRNPTATFLASPQAGYAPLAVELDARASRDPDGDPLTYEWAFDNAESASGAVIVRTFYAGAHTVELRVSDDRGGTDIETGSIAVQAVPEGYVAFVEELPGANTQGETLDEARENLKEAVALVLEANRAMAEQSLEGANIIRETFVLPAA